MGVIEEIKEKLEAEGFDGLYYPERCACEISDLAPCGECEKQPDDKYMNGCNAGYKFYNPDDKNRWCIKSNQVEPTKEEWARYYA